MAVLRVAHVWGDRLLDVRHLAGDGSFGPLTRSKGRLRMNDEAIAVVPGLATRMVLGQTALLLEYVEPPPKVVAAGEDDDWSFVKIAGLVLVCFVALVAMFILDVQLGFGADDTVTLSPTAYTKFVATPAPKKPRLDLEAARQKQLELNKQDSAHVSRAAKPLEARRAGLLDALANLGGGGGDVFAPGLNAGIDRAIDGLGGPPVGAAAENGLGGPRGFGPGGGPQGIGPGVFGIRRPVGNFSGELRKKLDVTPCCKETRVTDGLSKELVGKVIKRNFNAIKFCYELQLQHKPELSGKVMILFTIDGTGSVTDANVAESSLDDANVEACMLSQVRRWKFPEPAGGGTVSVSHPWFFKPAGSEE